MREIESERARESARERARESLVLLSKSASDSTTVATCAIILVNFPMRRIAASRAARHSTRVDLTRHCMCSETSQSERESERARASKRERERESERARASKRERSSESEREREST